jgi:hypothetical protein
MLNFFRRKGVCARDERKHRYERETQPNEDAYQANHCLYFPVSVAADQTAGTVFSPSTGFLSDVSTASVME